MLVQTYTAPHLVHTCRCNCASYCICHHSTGKGRDLQGRGWLLADDTSQHTFHFRRKAHQYTSFCKYRVAGTCLSDFSCSVLTSSTGNRKLLFVLCPLSPVPQRTPGFSGSLLTGTGNCFHQTTGRDLGRHQTCAPLHFSRARSRNPHRKSLFLALTGFAACFLSTSVLLHSQG